VSAHRSWIALSIIPFASARALAQSDGSARAAGTAIVSNMNDNTATVIDLATQRVLATLPTGEGPHEVAASHDGHWAVVSNYGVRGRAGHTLTLIELDHLRVARTIDLSPHERPHGMGFLPGDSLLAVTSEVSQAVLLVDVARGVVRAALPTHGRVSHMLALPSQNATTAFTSNIADGSITRLDLSRGAASRTTAVAKLVEGIAATPDGRTVWVASNGEHIVVVLDASGGPPVDTLTGFGLPYRIAISPDAATAVITDPERGVVRVIDARTRAQRYVVSVPRDSILATAEVSGSPSPEGVAISSDSRWAFITLQGRNRLMTVDLASGAILGYVPTGTWSDGIAYTSRVVR